LHEGYWKPSSQKSMN